MTDNTHLNVVVLVVDDEPLVRMFAADTLEDEGVQVFEAEDGSAALSMIAAHPEIDLLFSDVNMPGPLDGLGLAAEVHRLCPSIMILITSGGQRFPDAALPDNGTFLPKPYTGSGLVQAVRRKLDAERSPGPQAA